MSRDEQRSVHGKKRGMQALTVWENATGLEFSTPVEEDRLAFVYRHVPRRNRDEGSVQVMPHVDLSVILLSILLYLLIKVPPFFFWLVEFQCVLSGVLLVGGEGWWKRFVSSPLLALVPVFGNPFRHVLQHVRHPLSE